MVTSASALVLEGPLLFSSRTLDLPAVDENSGRLRIEACGLCGTDHEQYTGHLGAPFGFIPGHEIVGVVEDAGAEALARWGVAIGDRVAVEVFQSCRACPDCAGGTYQRCTQHGLADMYGFIDVEQAPGLWGGYSTHLHLTHDALLLPVPDALDPVAATLFNPLGAGIRWAVDLPGTGSGDVVAVLGPGIRGVAATVAAREAGVEFVMVTGVGPRDTTRLAEAERFGADLTVDVSVDDPAALLMGATGGLADVVVDVTAKAPTAPGQALQLVRNGGTVVLAGTRGTPEAPGFDPDLVVYKEINVIGALGVDTSAYRRALDLLATDRYPFASLPRRVVGFDELEQLLAAMAGEADDQPPVHSVFAP